MLKWLARFWVAFLCFKIMFLAFLFAVVCLLSFVLWDLSPFSVFNIYDPNSLALYRIFCACFALLAFGAACDKDFDPFEENKKEE